jgi:hypothetical protein
MLFLSSDILGPVGDHLEVPTVYLDIPTFGQHSSAHLGMTFL